MILSILSLKQKKNNGGVIIEHFIYDDAIDDVLDIIDSRLEYYDCLVIADRAGEMEWEKIEELELLRDMIKDLKYYKGE